MSVQTLKIDGTVMNRATMSKLDAYSKTVVIAKISLLLSAVTLGIGVFVVAKSNVKASQDAQRHIQTLYDARIMKGAEHNGLTANGTKFLLTSQDVSRLGERNNPTGHRLSEVKLFLGEQQATTTAIAAHFGDFTEDNNHVVLTGDVHGTTSDGFEFRTPTLTANIDLGSAEFQGPVHIDGPKFSIQSERLELDNFGQPTERYHFSGGVRVVYWDAALTQ